MSQNARNGDERHEWEEEGKEILREKKKKKERRHREAFHANICKYSATRTYRTVK